MKEINISKPIQRRSSEELMMRDHVEAWGRERWPDARVFHELVISDCRIDMAFIRPDDLIGVEIKSSKDTLDRLDKQMRVFRDHIPEVYVALAPKWKDAPGTSWHHNEIIVDEAGVQKERYVHKPSRNKTVYSNMLHLIWADEARSIAARKGCLTGPRQTLESLVRELALVLTGYEILTEVCRELRSRPTKNKADAPIADPSFRPRKSPNLFG